NLMASRRKMGRNLPPDIARAMWQQHARAALRETPLPAGETRAVLYNRWKEDPAYRKRLAGDLNLAFSDDGIDSVPDCAGGSSFDGVRFNGRAAAMNTDKRWVHFADER